MEAISAIYPEEDIVVKRPAPADTSMPSASFSIMLTAPSAELTCVPPSWIGQISLALDFPPGYPLDQGSDPRVSVEVGSLSMMEFPSAFKKSLYLAVVSGSIGCDSRQFIGPFACLSAQSWRSIKCIFPQSALYVFPAMQ